MDQGGGDTFKEKQLKACFSVERKTIACFLQWASLLKGHYFKTAGPLCSFVLLKLSF